MILWKTFFAITTLMLVVSSKARRSPRHMMDRQPSRNSLDVVRYPLCSVGGVEAACMAPQKCQQQSGRFAGYCADYDLVCCFVERSCGGRSSAHSVIFKNPSFPKHDVEATLCPLSVQLNRGVCAVRVEMVVLELAKYEDGVCIRDTLTILGSTGGIATPVCGNMTGFATTFSVKEYGEVTLALVAQSKHRFSITVSQLNCDDVPKFISPSYAGIRNADAVKYIPPPTTTTTKKPKTTTEAETESTPTTTPFTGVIRDAEEVEERTEKSTDRPPSSSEEEDSDSKTTEKEVEEVSEAPASSQEQTTLKTGKYPSRKATPKPEVIIRAHTMFEDDEKDDGIYRETIDVTPAISGFRKAFELKVQDKCWLYEEEEPELASFRVIGGFRSNLHEYPWQVALVYRRKFFCGGSLISDRFVLTAAHCVFGSFSRGIDQLRVSLGDHDLSTKNDTKNVVARVRRVIWHLHYSPEINVNDIALFELAEPVNFSYNVSAIKLPFDSEDQFADQNATVTGWGRYSIKTKKTSPILKEFTAPLVKGDKCAKAWKKFPTITADADKHLCLDVKMGTPCHGDSGGPLVACTGNSCTQVGLVSFGFPLCTNVGLPAVFTRLTYYRPWLDRNLAPLNARPV